jgi:glucokinase
VRNSNRQPPDPALWLVADIGGTNVRFALLSPDGKQHTEVAYLRCADFPGVEAAATEFLHSAGNLRPSVAAFAVAAPVNAYSDNDIVPMTNSAWQYSRTAIKSALALDDLFIINDFEAVALALPVLQPEQYRVLFGPAPRRIRATMGVIGAGTGLGVGGVVPVGDSWAAIVGEGGHVTLAVGDHFEDEVLRVVRADFPHVSAERLLSGLGLPTLYRAVAVVDGKSLEAPSPDQITQLARGSDTCAAKTVNLFCALLGSFAGNVALTLGAQGGLFIAGGIAPKLGDLFVQSPFRQRFEAKGRFRTYLESIATPLLVASDIALIGAGQAITARLPRPQRSSAR